MLGIVPVAAGAGLALLARRNFLGAAGAMLLAALLLTHEIADRFLVAMEATQTAECAP